MKGCEYMAKLKCPKCKSTNLDVLSNDKNYKTETSLNLNPLKPFTVFNHKKKEKVSKGKLLLGAATGGASLLVTGTKSKKHTEMFCRNCGNRWLTK